jgi:uncharacterized protein (DUF1330 family)
MPAYIVASVQITDPAHYARYIEQVPATIASHGGRYLARGGRALKLEGVWDPQRFVVLEFPTYEKALEWWHCGDYSGPKALRQAAAITNMILVDGV